MVKVGINPAMLRWAIDASRSFPEHVARLSGVADGRLEEFLNGVAEPNLTEVRAIGRVLDRSVQFFLLPEPPEPLALSAKFRSSLDEKSAVATKESAALRSAARAQRLVAWAAESDPPLTAKLPSIDPSSSPAAVAAQLQALLKWKTADQRKLGSKSAVLRELRARVEDLGVLVMLQEAGKDSFRGFSLPGSAPLIFINKDYQGAALRSFTLLHELAHLVSGTADHPCFYEDSPEERWCNQVATEFLLPEKHFRDYVEPRINGAITPDNLDVVRLASNYYQASWLAVSIRLQELGYGDSSVVEHIRNNWTLEKDPSAGGGPPGQTKPVLRQAEFGSTFVRALHKATAEKRLTITEAARLTRLNSKELQTLWQLPGSG